MTTHIKVRPKSTKKLKQSRKKRVVIDTPRIYWLLGLLMAKYRKRITMQDLAKIIGVTHRTMRHVQEGKLCLGVPALNKIVAFMRSEGFVVHPSDFLEDVPPSQTKSRKS